MVRQRQVVLAFLLSSLALAAPGRPVDSHWSQRGPYCAWTSGFAAGKTLADPAYLAVYGSLYRSEDGWKTWQPAYVSVAPPGLSTVAVDPANPRRVYLAVWNGPILRSDDAGRTYTPIFVGAGDGLLDEFVVSEAEPGTVYARFGYEGYFRSRNQGRTWVDISPTRAEDDNYDQLFVSPRSPQTLIAHTAIGLWRSTNAGESWVRWDQGLPERRVGLFALSWGQTETAYATSPTSLSDVYKKVGAAPWKRVGAAPGFERHQVLSVSPTDPNKVWLGREPLRAADNSLWISEDGGQAWAPAGLEGETLTRVLPLPRLGRVVALTASGAFVSATGRSNWQRTGRGVSNASVRSVAWAGHDGRALVAGLEGCAFRLARSNDFGKTWQLVDLRAPDSWLGTEEALSVASSPSSPRRVYAAGMDAVASSDDAGRSWVTVPFRDGRSGHHSSAMTAHPLDRDTVIEASSHGLSVSRDGAKSWGGPDNYPFDRMSDVQFAVSEPGVAFAGTESGGVYKTTDTGQTWNLVPGSSAIYSRSLVVDPTNANILIVASVAGTPKKAYRSTNGGLTWEPAHAGLTEPIFDLSISADGRHLYAAGSKGTFESEDGGSTWTKIPGIVGHARVSAVRTDGTVAVATNLGVAVRRPKPPAP